VRQRGHRRGRDAYCDQRHGKPAGSGFWVVELDKGECGAQAAGLVGCRFDAHGSATACGAAMVDDKNDDVVITTVSK
jgi:hypothetical protein